MKQDTFKTYAHIYEYMRGQIDNIHTVSELYSDDPEEAMRQTRVLLTSTQARANQFESEHLTPSGSTEPTSKVLDMQKQLYGDRPSDTLLT